MASENLQIRTIISQISVNNYMLSDIQQQRADIAEELTDVIQQFGQDSPQYQSALAQTNAIDADLELEQNELQISNQQLAAWKEGLEESRDNTINDIFSKSPIG
ncbi:hypothetical protein IJV79_00880 [bacterium]|nr:hypothetical protein [bacterium]